MHIKVSDKNGASMLLRVSLNDVLDRHVVEANTEEQWLRRFKLNDKGQIYCDSEDEPVTEIVYGKIELLVPIQNILAITVMYPEVLK